MAVGSVLAINLLFLVFFIVPGLVGIKGFLLVRRETDNYGRIETIVFSLIISITSALVLYAASTVILWESVSFYDLAQLRLPNVVDIFVVHSVLCSILGVTFGIANNIGEKNGIFKHTIESLPHVDGDTPRKEVWDFVFSEIHSSSVVSVITKQGHVITGNVVQKGAKIQERDLLLSSPTLKILMKDGNYSEKKLPNKTYSYVHNQNISQILLEEDLNRGDEDVAESMDIGSSEEPEDLSQVLEERTKEAEAVEKDDTILETIELHDNNDD